NSSTGLVCNFSTLNIPVKSNHSQQKCRNSSGEERYEVTENYDAILMLGVYLFVSIYPHLRIA
ncbi:MAG: hypothetical protein ACW7DR_19725, partial [Paraglaciecola chathamensis]